MALTWFITGCSSGFGNSLAIAALAKGDKVVATSRDSSKLSDLEYKGAVTADFNVNGSTVDVQKSFDEICAKYGPIDIVVNNAGYGQLGSIEENGVENLKKQYQTNVFGPMKVANSVLPHFRSKKAGLIINIGSRAGYDADPFLGLYCSSKAALQCLSKTLDEEVKPFGIRSILIEPGVFRTKFLSSFSDIKQRSNFLAASITDYDQARSDAEKMFLDLDGKQFGDPDILVEYLIQIGHQEGVFREELPSVVTFGSDSIASIEANCKGNLERIEEWKSTILSTDRADWM